MNKTFFLTGVVFAGLSVILGAFGSHMIKEQISNDANEIYKIANTYQMFHSFFFFILAGVKTIRLQDLTRVYLLMLFGILFFSGSLYFMALRELHAIDISPVGLVTPIGGILMILAWALLGLYAFKQWDSDKK